MIPYREQCIVEKTAQTTHATPGTRSTVTHGLGYAPTARHCYALARGVDGDTDDAAAINVVKTDATYVYVKSNKASVTFDLIIHIQFNTSPNTEA